MNLTLGKKERERAFLMQEWLRGKEEGKRRVTGPTERGISTG